MTIKYRTQYFGVWLANDGRGWWIQDGGNGCESQRFDNRPTALDVENYCGELCQERAMLEIKLEQKNRRSVQKKLQNNHNIGRTS